MEVNVTKYHDTKLKGNNSEYETKGEVGQNTKLKGK